MGLTLVFKDAEASRKAWLKRARAIQFGGKDTGWTTPDGKPLPKDVQDAIKRAGKAIPPAWTDVYVSTDPNSKLLVMGVDGKGRTQRVYSTEHSGEAAAQKFARVSALNVHMPAIFKSSEKVMLDTKFDDKTRDTAAVVNLIAKTGFRPGGEKDTGADEQAYGASTLEKRHVRVEGNNITFEFNSKSGQQTNKTLKDKGLAAYLSEKLPTLGDNEKVFKASGQAAGDYLKKIVGDSQFKIKDLRTWNGTTLALALLSQEEHPQSAKAFKELQNRVGDAVAEHLGNTRNVAIKSYIDPTVWPEVAGDMVAVKKK